VAAQIINDGHIAWPQGSVTETAGHNTVSSIR
jgi:hypothetical protein